MGERVREMEQRALLANCEPSTTHDPRPTDTTTHRQPLDTLEKEEPSFDCVHVYRNHAKSETKSDKKKINDTIPDGQEESL